MQLDTATITAAASAIGERLTQHRRILHRRPELGFQEHHTAAYIESVLTALGVEHRRVVGTGVVAVLRGNGARAVGIRADIDGLEVPEASGREGYRSEIEGISHACGHDGHVAILLGVAELLARVEDLPGTVALYFQPAEEGPGGAEPMVEAGVLDDPRPDAIIALHVSSQYPSGTVVVRPGAFTASTDTVRITVHGVGGHAAHPDRAVDAIVIASEVVLACQQIISREIDPTDPAVLTFGSIHGGSRENVIAPTVDLLGTMRALSTPVREHLRKRIEEVACGVAAAHRASATVQIEEGYPVGRNHRDLTRVVQQTAREVLGDERVVVQPTPSLGSEDFFDFAATGVPVCMFRLGVADASRGMTAAHHSPDFDLDEAALPAGVAVFVAAVQRLLNA